MNLTNISNITNSTGENYVSEMSDWERIFLIFGVSLIFWLLVLIIFHYFRRYRKDKLITNKLSTNYGDEIDRDDINIYLNDKGAKELADISNLSDLFERKSKEMRHKKTASAICREKIEKRRKESKNYSFFAPYKFIYNISDNEAMEIMNTEGYIYIYYQRITAYLFAFFSIVSIVFIVPLYLINPIQRRSESGVGNNSAHNAHNARNETINTISSILRPTVANAYNQPFKLWLILLLSVFYTLVAYYHLYIFVKKVREIQYIHIKVDHALEDVISRHTIHIRGINQSLDYINAAKLMETFFNKHFGKDLVGIQVIPNYDVLLRLIENKFKYQSQLDGYSNYNKSHFPEREKIKNKSLFNFLFGGKEIDAEVYYQHLVNINDKMLQFYRELNSKRNTGNAFIVFKSPEIVDEILKNKLYILTKSNTVEGNVLKIGNWIINRAPTPSDIIWDNIKWSKKWRTIRMIIFTSVLFFICLMILTPNYINDELSPIIATVSQHVVQDSYTRNMIKEYSYPLIVVVMNSGIIPVVVGYIALAELHYKRSYREKSIFVKNVVFMLINCFIIPTFGVLNIQKIQEGIKYLLVKHWDMDISECFIRNSYFFIRYAIQVTFISNGFQLLALPQIFVKKMRVFLAKSDYEKFYASMIKKYFDYGYNYSFSITVFVLIICFSTTIPLITPFGALFFFIKYYIDKYNLLFLYPAEFESHGNVTDMIIKFELIGIFIFQFMISNLFIKIFHDADFAICASILYIILSIFIYFGMKHLFTIDKNVDKELNIFERILDFTNVNKFLVDNLSFYNEDIKSSFINKEKSKVDMSSAYETMMDAYVHPAEKNTVNPMQIWNDAYTYMKTRHKREKSTQKLNLKEYNDIIINEEEKYILS